MDIKDDDVRGQFTLKPFHWLDILSLSEAGIRAGVDPDYLDLLARRGILPAFKKGGRWFVSDDDLEVYLNSTRRRRGLKKQLPYPWH